MGHKVDKRGQKGPEGKLFVGLAQGNEGEDGLNVPPSLVSRLIRSALENWQKYAPAP